MLCSRCILVRITGGKLKGRTISSSDAVGLRPTTSFFREWIFNVLNNHLDLDQVELLDLFSGTGIISFEFISRGAVRSTCVEKNRDLCSMINKSAEPLDISNIDVVCTDCISYLDNLRKNGKFNFNTVFIDAPYEESELTKNILSKIFSMSDLVHEELIIIFETSKSCSFDIPPEYGLIRSKTTGSTKMDIIRRNIDRYRI